MSHWLSKNESNGYMLKTKRWKIPEWNRCENLARVGLMGANLENKLGGI